MHDIFIYYNISNLSNDLNTRQIIDTRNKYLMINMQYNIRIKYFNRFIIDYNYRATASAIYTHIIL